MRITLIVGDVIIEEHIPLEEIDGEQLMFAIEKMINRLNYSRNETENYVVDWANDIILKRKTDGKD
jgi:hypothetical protein